MATKPQWRWARYGDIEDVAVMLKRNETSSITLADRLFDVGEGRSGFKPRSPIWFRDIVVGENETGIVACAYLNTSGLCLVSGDPGPIAGLDASRLIQFSPRRWDKLFCLMGPLDFTVRLQVALGIIPMASTRYWLLDLMPENDAYDLNRILAAADRQLWNGIDIVRAGPPDTGLLFELQCMYEIEEVLAPGHSLVPAHTRAQLEKSLTDQIVYFAQSGGLAVGKAGTNGQGWHRAQIGGVFTLPEWRSRGIGEQLMKAVLRDIFSRGMGACLFVKQYNQPALRLYEKLGFEHVGELIISYYSS